MRPAFVMFGPSHLAMLALTLIAPVLLVMAARRRPALDKPIRYALALMLAGGWLCWYALFAMRGWLDLGNGLPLNLCDWAAVALIIALVRPSQRAYELGYFWGLGGTVQGLATPGIAYGFPDPQFIFFFINHSGIVVALLYLTVADGWRPWPRSLPRVVVATLFYAVVAGLADWALGVDYGFLRAKPLNASIIDLLSPWPWYVPELVLIGLLSMAIYYTPFLVGDWLKTYRTQERGSPSRRMAGRSPLL